MGQPVSNRQKLAARPLRSSLVRARVQRLENLGRGLTGLDFQDLRSLMAQGAVPVSEDVGVLLDTVVNPGPPLEKTVVTAPPVFPFLQPVPAAQGAPHQDPRRRVPLNANLNAALNHADMRLERVTLRELRPGRVTITVDAADRIPLTEPDAVVRFVNRRTGKSRDFTLLDGNIPVGARLSGRAGDSFSVRLSDGVHNADLQQEFGVVPVLAGSQPGS